MIISEIMPNYKTITIIFLHLSFSIYLFMKWYNLISCSCEPYPYWHYSGIFLSSSALWKKIAYLPWQWHLTQCSLKMEELAINDLKNPKRDLFDFGMLHNLIKLVPRKLSYCHNCLSCLICLKTVMLCRDIANYNRLLLSKFLS